jgi:hypothetical protein
MSAHSRGPWWETALKTFGYLFIALLVTDALDIFIVGLQFPVFSTKWWALFVFSLMVLWLIREGARRSGDQK